MSLLIDNYRQWLRLVLVGLRTRAFTHVPPVSRPLDAPLASLWRSRYVDLRQLQIRPVKELDVLGQPSSYENEDMCFEYLCTLADEYPDQLGVFLRYCSS